ncbi:hypothetical protein EON81_12550 [bacterium]|nr:MAG: hypothetical protein EON81_12550 [bacterium]
MIGSAAALFFTVSLGQAPVPTWTPPKTRIPTEFVETVGFALANGLGDPRGGRYCEAQVSLGSLWGGKGTVVPLHGWLRQDGLFVAWDGQTYRPESVGASIDLATETPQPDLERLYSNPGASRAAMNGRGAAALLLLAGETSLAEKCWRASGEGEQEGASYDFCRRFLSSWFDRTVIAHMREDDREAAPLAQRLAVAAPKFEAFARKAAWLREMRPGQTSPAFDFLQPIDALAADSARRLAAPKPKADLNAIAQMPKERRIPALIEALDDIDIQQLVRPFPLALERTPAVKALVAEGTAAIPALLDCIEKDRRLTRSVNIGLSESFERSLVSVKTAAVEAFGDIYQIHRCITPEGNPWGIAEFRDFYAKMGDGSPEEVNYLRLLDDKAGFQVWEEAGRALLNPLTNRSSAGQNWLREKKSPALSELVARRVEELTVKPEAGSHTRFELQTALRLASMLAQRDPQAAVPVLRKVTGFVGRIEEIDTGDFVGLYGAAIAWRLRLEGPKKDRETMAEFEHAIAALNPSEYGGNLENMLFPLGRFSGRPEIDKTRRLFKGPLSFDRAGRYLHSDLVRSPVINSKPFREELLRLLNVKSQLEEIRIDSDSPESFAIRRWHGQIRAGDLDVPKPGEVRSYRVCDSIASSLAGIQGAPAFQMSWSTEAKNRAIVEIRRFLEKNGATFLLTNPRDFRWDKWMEL